MTPNAITMLCNHEEQKQFEAKLKQTEPSHMMSNVSFSENDTGAVYCFVEDMHDVRLQNSHEIKTFDDLMSNLKTPYAADLHKIIIGKNIKSVQWHVSYTDTITLLDGTVVHAFQLYKRIIRIKVLFDDDATVEVTK